MRTCMRWSKQQAPLPQSVDTWWNDKCLWTQHEPRILYISACYDRLSIGYSISDCRTTIKVVYQLTQQKVMFSCCCCCQDIYEVEEGITFENPWRFSIAICADSPWSFAWKLDYNDLEIKVLAVEGRLFTIPFLSWASDLIASTKQEFK